MITLYSTILVFISIYAIQLLLLNAIPNVRVRAIRWLALCGVTLKLPNARITIGRIGIKLNPSWSFNNPFRFLVIDLLKVKIVQTSSAVDLGKENDKKTCRKDLKLISVTIPNFLYNMLFKRCWINEIGLHVSQISYSHDAIGNDTSFFVDYIKLENTCNIENCRLTFAVSVLDGYVRSKGPERPDHKLFHNLEIQASSTATSMRDEGHGMMIRISNLEFLLVFGHLQIPDVSTFLDTISSKQEPSQRNQSQKKSLEDFQLNQVLPMIDLLSSFQIKVEQSTVYIQDIQISLSSYSLSVVKDISYKNETKLKILSNMTTADVYHLGLRCLDLPSLTHIVEFDLTDIYKAKDTDDPDEFFINAFTTLTITNPTLSIYFDQLNLFWDASTKHKHMRDLKPKPQIKAGVKEIFMKHEKLLKRFRNVSFKFAVAEMRATLHMPGLHNETFERMSINNIVTNADLKAFTVRASSRDLYSLIRRRISSPKFNTFKSFVKIKNLSIEVEKNALHISSCNALISYCVEKDLISLNIRNKRVWVKSVNTMIFHVIRRLREAHISHKNSACAKLNVIPIIQNANFAKVENQLEKELVDLFSIISPRIAAIKLSVSQLLAYIICNDMLPPYEIFNQTLGEDIDLGQIKRGVSIAMGQLNLLYNRADKDIDVTLKDIEASTLSDSISEFRNDQSGQESNSDLGDLSSIDSDLNTLRSFNSEKEVNTVQQVLTIPDCNLKNASGESSRLLLLIPEIDAKVDIFLIWCVFYAQTLLEMVAPKIARTYTKEQAKQLDVLSKYVLLDINVPSMAVKARIPHNVDVLFEIDHLNITNALESPQCQINHFRLYCVNPSTDLWSRLVSISEFYVNLKAATKLSIYLTSRTVRLNIPFGFLVYTVIDNLITFAKAGRQIRNNFRSLAKESNDFSSVPVSAEDALKLPRIQWVTKTFGLSVENDSFEQELSLIFEYGMIEQIERQRKFALFDVEAQKLRDKVKDRLTPQKPDADRFISNKAKNSTSTHKISEIFTRTFPTHCHNDSSQVTTETEQEPQTTTSDPMGSLETSESFFEEKEILTEEIADKRIEQARERLLQDFGTSWIHKYRLFKKAKLKLWVERANRTWGADEVLDLFAQKYAVQEYARGPPQMYMIFKDFDFTVDDPQLPDVHEFLHKHGKGTPKFEYSILIPALLQIKSSFVYAGAQDYLLPILSFPANSDFDIPVFDFEGTIVINEKLVAIPEELRRIYIPFSPAVAKNQLKNNFYGSDVIRTLTPVKFMFDLHCRLRTDKACNLSWNKSYSPALLSAMLALDNFTKPEIDDSPLGWWDKLALNAHGKLTFDIKNELCLHMKSSLSPYALSAENSGMVFCWKDNVKFEINGSDDPKEFFLVRSDDFILGIPNYSLPERGSWSLLYANFDDTSVNEELDIRKFQKEVMKLTSDEGVFWRLGILFERNEDIHLPELSGNMKRTDKFKPHWDVCVTGPMYDYHPDSFEGYRSDYIHLAVSVTSNSKKGNSFNYAYMSPMTLKYFFVWWDTLTESISLPIREGKLFSLESKSSSSVKFGPHLFTFKYQLVLEPLVISHMILSSGGQETNHCVIGTGMKGKFSSCIIDLHQRREVARYINTKLGIDKKVKKLKMNSGEIDITDADIRLIRAQFSDISLSGKLLSYFTGESNTLIDVDLFAYERNAARSAPLQMHYLKGFDPNADYLWIDLADFVELEYGDILSPDPSIEVIPLFLYPKLNYIREFTLEDPLTAYPFGNEASHTCLIGSNPPNKVQAELLLEKANQAKRQVEQNESILERISVDDPEKDSTHIRSAIDSDRTKMEKYQSLYDNIVRLDPVRRATSSSEHSDETSTFKKSPTHTESIDDSTNYMEAASLITNTEYSGIDYHNRFLIHNLRMIWNNRASEVFTSFLSLIGDKKSFHLAMSTKAVKLVENMLKNLPTEESIGQHRPVTKLNLKCGKDVVSAFEGYINKVAAEQELEHNFLVKFIRPQIQLQSEIDSLSCAILAANDIELRISALNLEGTSAIIHDDAREMSVIETRHGALFKDAYLFTFQRENYPEQSFKSDPYNGTSREWPPWIDVEDCEEVVLKDNLVFEKTTMALSMTKPNMLSLDCSDKKQRSNELIVHLAKIVINATSSQYSAIYFIMTDLLMGVKETKNFLRERIKQIIAVSEVSDFMDTSEKIKNLQHNLKVCRRILLKLNEYATSKSELHQRERDYLRLEIEKMKIELIILIRSVELIRSKSSTKAAMTNWSILADQIIIHLLEDDRQPLVDLALASSKFSRIDAHDGSNWNTVEVLMMQGFNLQPKAVYPVLLSPLEGDTFGKLGDTASMIRMSWRMLSPVGGINVMSNAELKIQPLHVQLDYGTAKKLFGYLFPKEEEKDKNSELDRPDYSFDENSEDDSVSLDSASSSYLPNQQFAKRFRKVLRQRDEGTDLSSEHSTRSSRRRTSPGRESAHSSELHSRADSRADSRPSKTDSKSDSKRSKSDSKSESRPSKLNSGSTLGRMRRPSTKVKKAKHSDEILVIMDRSSTYFVVGDFSISKFNLCLSFKAPKHLNIIDVHNLTLSIPKIHYADKTWSSHDFVLQIQKDIAKIVLVHSGKIIGNKFRHRRREVVSTPLRQIEDYSQYMTVDDLQREGRTNGKEEIDHKGHKNTTEAKARND